MAQNTVQPPLFSITCTTCQARLKVRDPSAIGAILSCPKCESMVQVIPPPGWTMPAVVAPAVASRAMLSQSSDSLPVEAAATPVETSAPATAATTPPVAAGNLPPGDVPLVEGPPPVAVAVWTPLRLALITSALLASGLLVAVGVAALRHKPANVDVIEKPVEAPAVVEVPAAAAEVKPERPASAWDLRFVPDDARLVVSLQPSRLSAPEVDKVLARLGPMWSQAGGSLLESLRLGPSSVRKLSYARTNLASPDSAVWAIELEASVDAAALLAQGKPTDGTFGTAALVKLPSWSHPLALVEPKLLVTGSAETLAALAARQAPPRDLPIDKLLASAPVDGAVVLWVDLNAARAAGWPLPVAWFDLWPAGRAQWRLTWDTALALALVLRPGEQITAELTLLGEGPSGGDRLRSAIGELLAEGNKALAGQSDTITALLQDGKINAAQADQFELLIKQGQTALKAARIEAQGEVVRLRAECDQKLANLARAVGDSTDVMALEWRLAARAIDEANHRYIVAGLSGYGKAEGGLPAGAVGGALLPPETRLSWIATLLPYFGQAEWHRQLEFGYAWNAPQNRAIAKRTLEPMINPQLGASTTDAGYPVTHYVGVAGVGEDAGTLPATDPRAGAFGYARNTRPADITDGASNTIAVLGVQSQLGPWAAGGKSTVRPLTKAPYVNGPDGFGSGQADGMLAGMADGSVRFISSGVDPRIVEQLATIHGGESATAAQLEALPVARAEKAKPKEAKPAEPAPVEPEAPAVPRRPAVAMVDVESRLEQAVPELELKGMELGEALKLIGDLAVAPIAIDPDAMTRLGVTLADPVTLKVVDGTLRQVLTKTAESVGMKLMLIERQALVTSPEPERRELQKQSYDTADLTGRDAATTQALAATLVEFVAPDTWQPAGGRGRLTVAGQALEVEQTPAVQIQVTSFLERLRAARKLPLRTQFSADRFPLDSRLTRARATLDRRVTLNVQSAPAGQLVSNLERTTQTRIVCDWPALYAAGLGIDTPLALKANRVALGDLLDTWLAPLGLAARVVDARLIQITTRKALADRLELEFYPAADLLKKQFTAATLIERVKSVVAKGSWNDAGGPAAIACDAPSGYLLVLQSQPVHAQLERLLADLRGGR